MSTPEIQEILRRLRVLELLQAPIGSIVAFAGPVARIPDEYKLCDGESLDKNQFPQLWDRIGNHWGGDGSPMFNLPDLRGYFLRGVDAGSNRDIDRTQPFDRGGRKPLNPTKSIDEAGSIQMDQMQGHWHSVSSRLSAVVSETIPENFAIDRDGAPTGNGNEDRSNPVQVITEILDPTAGSHGTPRFGRQTHPPNAYVHWIIRVR